MGFFDALHEGLRRVETWVDSAGKRVTAPGGVRDSARDWYDRMGQKVTRDDRWPVVVWGTVATLVILTLLILPILLPVFLVATIVGGVVLFAGAWGREFLTLMRLDDQVFPGRFDKLVWGLLMILAPPVGLWLFGSYRETHWGVAKPGEPIAEV